MPIDTQATRIGDLLLKRGEITPEQLNAAIAEQRARRQALVEATPAAKARTALGEILVDLGFVERKQLLHCLTWQKRLRKVSFALAFVTPLLSVSTPASATGATYSKTYRDTVSDTGATQDADINDAYGIHQYDTDVNDSDDPFASTTQDTDVNDTYDVQYDTDVNDSNDQFASATQDADVNDAYDVQYDTDANDQFAGAIQDMNDLNEAEYDANVSNDQNTDTDHTGDSTEPTPTGHTVALSWIIPELRGDGATLSFSEIAGYEIIYQKHGDSLSYSIIIDDPTQSDYVIENLESGEYEFMVAAFDTDGLFSEFTKPVPKAVE